MKKLTGLIIILLVLILGGAYVTGIITEKSLKDTMITMNSMEKTSGFSAQLKDYQRGWFKSKSTIAWKVHVPEQIQQNPGEDPSTVPARDFEFQLPITIYHGPVIFVNKSLKFGLGYAFTEINLPADYEEEFKKIFTETSQKPRLDMSIFVNYLNKSEVTFSVPAFKATTKDNINFEWKGLSSTISASRNMKQIDGDFKLDGLEITKANKDRLSVGKLITEYNLEKAPEGFYVGTTSLSFPSLKLEQAGKTSFALEKLSFSSETSIDDHRFDAHLKASMEKMINQEKIFGPGKLDFSITNLDSDSLARIHTKVIEIQQNNPNPQGQHYMMAILPELPQLLSREPELEISNLYFKMPAGVIEGNLKLSLPKAESSNPLVLMQSLEGKGSLSMPTTVLKEMLSASMKDNTTAATQPELQQALVSEMQNSNPGENKDKAATESANNQQNELVNGAAEQANTAMAEARAQQQIDKLLQSGLIVAKGDEYLIEFTLKKGQLTVNGKPFEKSMLQF